MMRHTLRISLCILVFTLGFNAALSAFPKPSAYPISWQLKFEHSEPKRLVMAPKGEATKVAYWYMTFTVTNLSKEEQKFLPRFEMLAADGKVIRSDSKIDADVLAEIRIRERNKHLEEVNNLAGTIRVGEDQTRDGVVVWKEPEARMGRFSIFAAGLSGEATILKDSKGAPVMRKNADGKEEPIVLWKTLQIDYHMAGDEKFPGNDIVDLVDEQWIMR